MSEVQGAKCEGILGGNVCGRQYVFVITDTITEAVFFSCVECVGRIIIENDLDSTEVERVY